MLEEYYPSSEYNVQETADIEFIKGQLESKGVTTWGNGPIEGTEYYKLAHCSPRTKYDKPLIIVCKKGLVK